MIKYTHKPIIEQELFDKVQNRINFNKRAKTHKHKWNLNGIVYCKECGKQMGLKVGYRKDGTTISYMRLYCSSTLRKKEHCVRKYRGIDLQTVTQIVVNNLNAKVNNIVNCDNVAELIKKNYKSSDTRQYEKELKANEKQLEKCNKIIFSLYQDYKTEIISEYDFKMMYEQEISKRDLLNEKISNVKQRINNKKKVSELEFKRIARKILDVKKWNKEQLRDVIESIEIDNEDNIFINYKYDILE